MDNTYILVKDTVVEILNEIDIFKTRMNKFIEKYPKYEYKIDKIKKVDGKYTTSVNIIKDEQ